MPLNIIRNDIYKINADLFDFAVRGGRGNGRKI